MQELTEKLDLSDEQADLIELALDNLDKEVLEDLNKTEAYQYFTNELLNVVDSQLDFYNKLDRNSRFRDEFVDSLFSLFTNEVTT